MEINDNREFVEMGNDELVVNAANDNLPPQDAPTNTTTTEAAAEEGGDNNENDDEADYTKGGGEGGAIPRLKTATAKMMKTRRRGRDVRSTPSSSP